MSLGSLIAKGAMSVGGSVISGLLGGLSRGSSTSHIANQMVGSPRFNDIPSQAVDLPSMQPANDNVKRVSAPTVMTLSVQLNSILQVAGRISSSIKRQQDMLISQNQQKRHAEKERIMEDAAKEDLNNNGLNLEPTNESLLSLTSKIKELIGAIDSAKGGGGGDSGDSGGFLEGLLGMMGLKKGIGLLRGSKAPVAIKEAATGRYRDPKTGRFIKEAEALERPGALGKAGRLTKSALMKIPGASKIAGIFAKGVAKSGAVKEALGKAAIKKLAVPIISKALGKTVLKSIPIIGAIAGVGLAAARLVDGDVVGAGLDAVSGLGGPLTAIPALIASVSRDIYKESYGVDPEDDPEAMKRMGEIVSAVKDVVEETIKPLIMPKSKPTTTFDRMPDGSTKVSHTNQTNSANNDTSYIPNKPPAPAAKPQSKPSPAPAAKPHTSHKGTSAAVPVAAPITNNNQTGKSISEMSVGNQSLSTPSANDNNATASSPDVRGKMPNTKAGYTGVGNVPDPTYYGADGIVNQLYFESAVWA